MAYEKQTWIDGVSPLNAERFNHMEDGIAAAFESETAIKAVDIDFNACINEIGLATDTGEETPQACPEFWITGFINIENGGHFNSNYAIYKIGFYDSNKKAKGTLKPTDAKKFEILSGSAYVRLQFEQKTLSYEARNNLECKVEINKAGYVSWNPQTLTEKQKEQARANIGAAALEQIGGNKCDTIGDFLFSFPLVDATYMSDHTMIGNKLYVINASSDDHSAYAGVTVYNIDIKAKTATYEKTIQHNLGHANTIDYCAGNDCLILGNGSSDSTLPCKIFILTDVSKREKWEYSDCIVIDIGNYNVDDVYHENASLATADGNMVEGTTTSSWVLGYVAVTSDAITCDKQMYKCCFYDADYAFVSTTASSEIIQDSGVFKSTVPSDAVYVRIMFQNHLVKIENANSITWQGVDVPAWIPDSGQEGAYDWGSNIKMQAVWGEHNDEKYNVAYVISNNNKNVRQIMLGKTDGVFDGTYKVLDEWSTSNGLDVNQGTVYRNGKLYCALGHSQLWLSENTLNDDGTITQKQRKDVFLDADGAILTTPYSEGITIHEGYLYFGGSNSRLYVYRHRG